MAPIPAPPQRADLERTNLGRYEVLRHFATGGMAELYIARARTLPGVEKIVVVKRILPQLAALPDFLTMFLDEARIAVGLQHPNIVQTYDVEAIDGNYLLAMEYLHGEDLRSLLRALRAKGRRPSIGHAIQIALGVLAGLHYAHEKVGLDGRPLDIVHRDVTPQNVIVTYDGGVKLLDFGIAKSANRAGRETKFGTVKGKTGYMSPEQCRGEPLDRRSDIFSLGILLYELSTGRWLYRGPSEFDVFKQIIEGPIPSARLLDPTFPVALDEIIRRALQKEPASRYQTAREMALDLEALAHELRIQRSEIALASYMEEIFGRKVEAWRGALADHENLAERLAALHASPREGDPVETGEREGDMVMVMRRVSDPELGKLFFPPQAIPPRKPAPRVTDDELLPHEEFAADDISRTPIVPIYALPPGPLAQPAQPSPSFVQPSPAPHPQPPTSFAQTARTRQSATSPEKTTQPPATSSQTELPPAIAPRPRSSRLLAALIFASVLLLVVVALAIAAKR